MRLGINLAGHSSLRVYLEGHLHNTNFIHLLCLNLRASIVSLVYIGKKTETNGYPQ